MIGGFAGTVLEVDLTTKEIRRLPVTKELAAKYLGGRGINAYLLWQYVSRKGVEPLSSENVLIFGTGSLSGTHAPSSGRTTVTCKSPATGLYLKASGGGYFGIRLKLAGYDHLVVKGSSQTPVYLYIEDGRVEIRDASHLWGRTVSDTDRLLKEELGKDVETAVIGPAGEKLARIASVMLSRTFAAARGGPGAVMGSKRLKAVAVRGTGSLKVSDPAGFDRAAMAARKALAKDSGAQGLHVYGTAGLVEGVNASGGYASYNFRQGYIDGVRTLTGQYLVEAGYLQGRLGCGSCGISCHRFCAIPSGRYAGTKTAGPEYETTSALGAGCGVTDTEALIKAASLCNEFGLDTISTGGVIQWAMECFERGILTLDQTEGLDLTWGNGDAVVSLVEKIAYRRGLGDILAEGTRRASEEIGHDSWKWAVQARGLEQSRVETRSAKSYALAFAVNPRGPDHLHTETLAEFGLTPEARELIKEICGDEKYANPFLLEKRAEIVRWHEDCYAVTDALGFCAFATTLAYAVNPANMAEMFSKATGIDMSEEEIMFAGRRIVTLERMFSIKEGLSRADDVLPWRLMNEPVPSGPTKGFMNSKEELDKMLDEYYALHEWDVATGIPKVETLKKLGLADFASWGAKD